MTALGALAFFLSIYEGGKIPRGASSGMGLYAIAVGGALVLLAGYLGDEGQRQ